MTPNPPRCRETASELSFIGHRGQSIGVRLLADLVAFARVRGADLLTLNTQSYNTDAQRLYEWFGFRRTGERQAILRYDL